MFFQAINETLLLLTRQYKQIKDELEMAKLSFIKVSLNLQRCSKDILNVKE